MGKTGLIKVVIVIVVLACGALGFWFTRRTETQTVKPVETPENVLAAISGFRDWTKVNPKPVFMPSRLAAQCTFITKEQMDSRPDPHSDIYINVYVNELGKEEMLTKKNPHFPVGTVVVKEKFPFSSEKNPAPELLTVMIKRDKGFNPEVGDWEFMTVNGAATEITSRGKLQSCQTCHLNYERNDFITRKYLPAEIKQNLK